MVEQNIDRSDFARRQAEMTEKWFEQVKRTHGDVEKYIAGRYAAYLDRWKEAARFIPDGSTILDIGGGNLDASVLQFLMEKRLEYHYLDIDPSAVKSSQELAAALGMPPKLFRQGFNDELHFANETFDAIFSSHCVEHSFDLERTLSEIHRVLIVGGSFLMAVPIGWEINPEHPYFLAPTDWISLLASVGFTIRIAQIGREYPEVGFDLFVCCRKVDRSAHRIRIDPNDYKKTNFQLMAADASDVTYSGETQKGSGFVMCVGNNWGITIKLPLPISEALLIFHRHDWSGIIQVQWGSNSVVEDLYSWFPYTQPVRVSADASRNENTVILIRPLGRNPLSADCQGVFWGVMYR
jgi:SAM-dependent methyltransferase